MSRLQELLTGSNLIKLLSDDGSEVVGRLVLLMVKRGMHEECSKTVDKVFDSLDGKPWLIDVVALFFCLDRLLQEMPGSQDDQELDGKMDEVIDELEKRMRKGKKQ